MKGNVLDNNSRRILKNTIVLYIRMGVTMLIALYTSRVVLANLGVEDYGLYSVVGGVVALFSFLRTSMTSATQRFLSYELGSGDKNQLGSVFSTCLWAHVLIASVIFVLCETIGLWFLNTKINIPVGRESAANWIFQFSVVTLCVDMLVVPYNACVISHERMTIFAYVSVLSYFLKLLIALAISISPIDNLVFYGALMMLVCFVEFFLYFGICRKKFHETKGILRFNRKLFLRIFGFSGWTLLGQLAVIGSGQGASILTNIFYSVTANAAMGVAQQANGAISGLVSNFQTAYQPQITKSYASKDWEFLQKLIVQASKISFFLLFVVSLPIVFNIDFLLNIWLGNVPQYTAEFVIFFLIASMLNAIGGPLWMSVFATGKIRNYQIAVSVVFLLDVVLVYVLFALGFSPVFAVVAKVITNFVVIFVRMLYAKKQVVGFSMTNYLQKVIVPIFVTVVIVVSLSFLLFHFQIDRLGEILATCLCLIFTVVTIYFVALSRGERKAVFEFINNKIKK